MYAFCSAASTCLSQSLRIMDRSTCQTYNVNIKIKKMATTNMNNPPRPRSLVEMTFFLLGSCCFPTALALPPSNAYVIPSFSFPDGAGKRRVVSSSSVSLKCTTDQAISDASKEPRTLADTPLTETATLPPFDFDFASQSGWEEYYQQLDHIDQKQDRQDVSSQKSRISVPTPATTPATVVEWHSSVRLKDLASLTLSFLQRQNVQKKIDDDGDKYSDVGRSNCRNILLVGCGNSLLPDVILHKQEEQERARPSSSSSSSFSPSFSDRRKNTQLILMDTSPTCLQQVQSRLRSQHHTKTATNGDRKEIADASFATEVKYVCGDSTRLSEYFSSSSSRAETDSNTDDVVFDVIVDKGLADAIWCNEGWDGMLERLFDEVAKVLRKPSSAISAAASSSDRKETEQHVCGKYILVCYKLSKSHKEFLIDVGKRVGLEWEFDIPPPFSNNRVSVSIATACYL